MSHTVRTPSLDCLPPCSALSLILHTADLKATFQLQILGVKKNPQSPMYTQLGVLTKGTVIEVNVSELGMVTAGGKVVFGKYAQVTNNPENDGCINAVLRALTYDLSIHVVLTMNQSFNALDGIFLVYCISKTTHYTHAHTCKAKKFIIL